MFGRNSDIAAVRAHLVRSLVSAAKDDPYSEALYGPMDRSHGDGWGSITVVVGSSGVERIRIERSLKPLFEDEEARALDTRVEAPGDRLGLVMIHARAASAGMPVNIFSTHPAEALTSRGWKLYLVHNGSVDKDRILEDLGIDKMNSYARLYSDTHFLAHLIASRVGDSINGEILREAASYTSSALNIGVALVKEREVEVAVGSFYRLADKPAERRNYYRLYKAQAGDMLFVYASSTLVDIYRPSIGLTWGEVPNGFFEVYRLRYGDSPSVDKIEEVYV